MGYYNNVHYILSTATACNYIINYLDLNPSMPKPHGIFRLQPPDVTLIKRFKVVLESGLFTIPSLFCRTRIHLTEPGHSDGWERTVPDFGKFPGPESSLDLFSVRRIRELLH